MKLKMFFRAQVSFPKESGMFNHHIVSCSMSEVNSVQCCKGLLISPNGNWPVKMNQQKKKKKEKKSALSCSEMIVC